MRAGDWCSIFDFSSKQIHEKGALSDDTVDGCSLSHQPGGFLSITRSTKHVLPPTSTLMAWYITMLYDGFSFGG